MSELPIYLKKEYFNDFLQKRYKNTSVQVQSLDIKPCGVTEGFLSILKRIRIKYIANSVETSNAMIILKFENDNEFINAKVGEKGYNVTSRELNFFSLLASRFEQIALEKFDCKLIPSCLKVDEENKVMIFEDLHELHFYTVAGNKTLNDNQTRLCLQKLAKFHAISMILNQKYPNIYKNFDVGMFNRKVDAFNDAFESLFEVACDEILTWKGFEKYALKMKKLQPFLIENVLKCFDVYPNDFCVLNHGDLWKNNVMLKYDSNGNAIDVVLLDFQFPHWASPVLDLHHFLYTSLDEDLYNQASIELFTQYYYYQLKESLSTLNYEIKNLPSLHSFQLEFDKKLFYGFIYTLLVFPIMNSKDPDNKFEYHHSRDERSMNFKRRVLKDSKYRRVVERMLPVFDSKGVLDEKISNLVNFIGPLSYH